VVILTGSWATARLFSQWRPDLRLMGETSGKNALLISATADIDAAVKDLVASAFGHAGQKCSAASLAIVEASIHDNPAFLRQLRDAVTTEVVGAGPDPATVIGPVIRPAEGPLLRASVLSSMPHAYQVEIISQSERMSRQFGAMIADAIADGSIRPVDPAIAGALVHAAVNVASDIRDLGFAAELDIVDRLVRAIFSGLDSA